MRRALHQGVKFERRSGVNIRRRLTADRFDFKTKLASAKNAATISEFNADQDTIGLSRTLFTKIGDTGPLKDKFFHVGTHAADKNDSIIFNSATGKLYYDSDGRGSSDQVLFAKVD